MMFDMKSQIDCVGKNAKIRIVKDGLCTGVLEISAINWRVSAKILNDQNLSPEMLL
jgi:hypothetical protein